MVSEQMKITVYYDYICPFCFLGSRTIEELAREFSIRIEWKGLEIHPEFPPSGTRRKRSLRIDHLISSVKEMAGENNMEITLPGFVTNSRLALEASEYAKEKGFFKELHYGIYEAYFKRGINIGDKSELLRIGQGVGIKANELWELFENRTMKDRIQENEFEAREKMILGVPTYIIGGFPLYGNQNIETMRLVIEKAMKSEAIE